MSARDGHASAALPRRRLAAGSPAIRRRRRKPAASSRCYDLDSPASMSIHEEATDRRRAPMMGVFNNLVMFDQHVPQNSLESIVPDLATELVVERGRHAS